MKTKVQSISWDAAFNVCTIDYQKIGKKVVFDRRDFTPEIRDYAEVHGYTQRAGDQESGDKVGEAKFQAVSAWVEHCKTSTDWTLKSERDTLTELIAAVHKVIEGELTVEELVKAAAADPDQIQDWRDDNRVKVELAAVRLAKAQARAAAEKPKPLKIKGLK